MTGYFVTLFVLLALAVSGVLVFSGWGKALLLWPFGVRPMFSTNASLVEIYGMDVVTCDITAFHERHDALRTQAESSRLATLNVARLNKAFMKASEILLPRLSAMTANARAAHLEAYSDQREFVEQHNKLAGSQHLHEHVISTVRPAELSWRQVLFLSGQTPTRKELQKAYEKALSDVQASAKATTQVEIAMSQAMSELQFKS